MYLFNSKYKLILSEYNILRRSTTIGRDTQRGVDMMPLKGHRMMSKTSPDRVNATNFVSSNFASIQPGLTIHTASAWIPISPACSVGCGLF